MLIKLPSKSNHFRSWDTLYKTTRSTYKGILGFYSCSINLLNIIKCFCFNCFVCSLFKAFKCYWNLRLFCPQVDNVAVISWQNKQRCHSVTGSGKSMDVLVGRLPTLSQSIRLPRLGEKGLMLVPSCLLCLRVFLWVPRTSGGNLEWVISELCRKKLVASLVDPLECSQGNELLCTIYLQFGLFPKMLYQYR